MAENIAVADPGIGRREGAPEGDLRSLLPGTGAPAGVQGQSSRWGIWGKLKL